MEQPVADIVIPGLLTIVYPCGQLVAGIEACAYVGVASKNKMNIFFILSPHKLIRKIGK